MITKRIVCDICRTECDGNAYVVFTTNKDGDTVGRKDICEDCWAIATEAMKNREA